MLVRTVNGRIIRWSPAMQQRYGFTSDEVLGREAHQVLGTIFGRSPREIQAILDVHGSWSGGLIHRHADGRRVITSHYWRLHHHVDGDEPMISEWHADISFSGLDAAAHLADVMDLISHELRQPLTALGNYVCAASRSLRGWRDDDRLNATLASAAEQISRFKAGMSLFRELGEALRPAADTNRELLEDDEN
jgi:PAS domain S-box-containing protein